MSAQGDRPSPWVLAGEPTSLGDPSSLVTLVNGQTFCLSGRSGDFSANPAHGVFFADMRVLSMARLLVGGATVESLAVNLDDASSATFVGRSVPLLPTDPRVLVIRRRQLGSVWHEDLEFLNTGSVPMSVAVELEVAADFADVYALKEGRVTSEGQHSLEVHDDGLLFGWRLDHLHRQAAFQVRGVDMRTSIRGCSWTLDLDAHSSHTVELDLSVALGEAWIERRHHVPRLPGAGQRHREWIATVPRVRTSDRSLSAAYERSVADVAALRLHDPSGRNRPVIAAGAPWYMTLFGRDALLCSYMAMPVDPSLALGVLDALAELQGDTSDPMTEEQPGRILHETRSLDVEEPTLTGGSTYYGSVDATPLFVMVLGELARWGIDDADLARLLPHADRALQWVATFGDPDQDGFVEYERSSERGLINQGWKDSVDGIRFDDGRIATAPLALCEAQGYVYAAHLARADLADRLSDTRTAARHRALAAELKDRFNRAFWMPRRGWYAVALGPDKEQVDSLTSNIGHCLWTGIVDDDHAEQVVERLLASDMYSGWGVRTMSSSSAGYDPMSYHCGTVWPHDSALCAAGMRRYGFDREASTIADGLFAAAAVWSGRLPELFSGLDRSHVGIPVPFPTSCSPQAWAATTPFLLLRTLLGLEPTPSGPTIDPVNRAFDNDLALTGVWCSGRRYDVRVVGGVATVSESAPPPSI
ncbi:MAG: amylo-alpha-1,6-glucosidase [Actinobacteria bacterium]|nr:amylo-alpha-1,6-glucosidase [Actinomycetota bacterium]